MSVEGGSPGIGEGGIGSSIGANPGPSFGAEIGSASFGGIDGPSALGSSFSNERGAPTGTMEGPGFGTPVIDTNLSQLDRAFPNLQTMSVEPNESPVLNTRVTVSPTDILSLPHIHVLDTPVLDRPLPINVTEPTIDIMPTVTIPMANVDFNSQTENMTLEPINLSDFNPDNFEIIVKPVKKSSQDIMDGSIFVPLISSPHILAKTGLPDVEPQVEIAPLQTPESAEVEALAQAITVEATPIAADIDDSPQPNLDEAATSIVDPEPQITAQPLGETANTEHTAQETLLSEVTTLVDEPPQLVSQIAEALEEVRSKLQKFIGAETPDTLEQSTEQVENETQPQAESMTETLDADCDKDEEPTMTVITPPTEHKDAQPEQIMESTYIHDEGTNHKRSSHYQAEHQAIVAALGDEQDPSQNDTHVSQIISGSYLVTGDMNRPEYVSDALLEQGITHDPTNDYIQETMANTVFTTDSTEAKEKIEEITEYYTAVARIDEKVTTNVATEDEVEQVFHDSRQNQAEIPSSGVIFLDSYRNRFSNKDTVSAEQIDIAEPEELLQAA